MRKAILTCAIAAMTSSCATVFQGFKTTDCQKQQRKNAVHREYRPGIIILDCCCGVIPLVIDFADGAVYSKQTRDCKNPS